MQVLNAHHTLGMLHEAENHLLKAITLYMIAACQTPRISPAPQAWIAYAVGACRQCIATICMPQCNHHYTSTKATKSLDTPSTTLEVC